MADAARRRVVRWDRPDPSAPEACGLDMLHAMVRGERPPPPVASLIGMRVVAAEAGRVRMAITPAEYQYNPLGSVHGGVIATVLDSVLACAVLSMLPPGRGCVTLEIKVNYLRALTQAAGEVVGEGTVVHSGRQVGVAEARLADAAGRVYATASATLLVIDSVQTATTPDEGREHVVEWDDPQAIVQAAAGMSGIAMLHAMQAGSLPRAPVARLLPMHLAEVTPGRVAMTLQPAGHLTNPNGTMHGGMIATLLDSAMGCAVQSTLPTGRGYTTLELKVNYIRGITAASGLITGTGQVVHGGRRVAVAEGRAVDAAGRLCATASTTCLVFDRP